MSKPVEEAEISALIDGELDAARAAEVRSAIERDPVLRAQFDFLAAEDIAWAGSARSACFAPAMRWDAVVSQPRWVPMWVMAALVIMLIAARVLPKVLQFEVRGGMVVHALVLAVVIGVVVWISGRGDGETASRGGSVGG